MTDALTRNRLRPSLLDRLTDDHPDRLAETAAERAVNEVELRDLVRRDLTWLFNTTHLGPKLDSARYPEASRSIVNFGIPDLTGRTLSGVEPDELEHRVIEAIRAFEPRLVAESLRVRVLKGSSRSGMAALIFEIQADLWAEPLPLQLHLRSEVDLESGRVAIEDTREER